MSSPAARESTVVPARPEGRRLPRPLVTTALLVACWLVGMILFGTAITDAEAHSDPRAKALLPWDALLGQVACLGLFPLLRSKQPRRVGVAAVVAVLCSVVSSWSLPVVLYAIVLVSSWRRWQWTIGLDVLVVGASAAGWWLAPVPLVGRAEVVVGAVLLLLLNLWGTLLGQGRELRRVREERTQAALREQAAVLARVRSQERTAMAREMHDTLSHRLAVISLHAGGLSVRGDADAGLVTSTATVIQQTAHQASEELRVLLGVLRDDAADRAQPVDVAQLGAVVDEARGWGLSVRLSVEPGLEARLDGLSPTRSAAVAHVVREGLANAMKHAPGAAVDVVLADQGGGVLVTVANPLGQPPTTLPGGNGLVGLQERLRLADGWLRHGAAAGRHLLEAWVPWQ